MTWLINTLMISYMLGGVDGMWFVSLLIKIPFTILKVVLKQKGLSCRLQRIGINAWHPGNDMITDLFQDDSLQHTHEYFQPPSCLDIYGYEVMANLEKSKSHPTKRNNFHLEDFYSDSQMKRQCFSFSRHDTHP
jgi:hypothetical protein